MHVLKGLLILKFLLRNPTPYPEYIFVQQSERANNSSYLEKFCISSYHLITPSGLGLPYNESLNGIERVDYLKGCINATLRAIRYGPSIPCTLMSSSFKVRYFPN